MSRDLGRNFVLLVTASHLVSYGVVTVSFGLACLVGIGLELAIKNCGQKAAIFEAMESGPSVKMMSNKASIY